MLRTDYQVPERLDSPRAQVTTVLRPRSSECQGPPRRLVPLLAMALAVAASVLAAQEWAQQVGSVAFFFFFHPSGAFPPARFVPTNWTAVGRFVAADTAILVALERDDPVVTGSAPPVKWQRVTSIADSDGVMWALFATELVPLGKETPWEGPADLVRGLLDSADVHEPGDPTIHTEEDRERWLRAMFRFAVIRSDVDLDGLPSWLRHRAARPLADGVINVELFPGLRATLTHHVEEDGSVLVRVADQEALLSDLLGVLSQLRARAFLPDLSRTENEVLNCERRVLDALVHDRAAGPDDRAVPELLSDLRKVQSNVNSAHMKARESANAVSVLRAAPATHEESERLHAISKDLDDVADELRTQGRSLVSLAAPLAAERRAQDAQELDQKKRQRTDRVVLLATIGATIIGVPALVAGFFGATVTPLAAESPFSFGDLLIAAACLSILTSVAAEVFLHRPKRKWWWAARLLLGSIPAALAGAWMYRSAPNGGLAMWVTTVTLFLASVAVLSVGRLLESQENKARS